jgi:integrase
MKSPLAASAAGLRGRRKAASAFSRQTSSIGALAVPFVRMTTNVYVDGFNLYYGAVRGTPFKWLDIRRYCELAFPKAKIKRGSLLHRHREGRDVGPTAEPQAADVHPRARDHWRPGALWVVSAEQLAWGMARSLATRDASVGIKNPKRKRHERRDVLPFESWANVDKVADELPAPLRVIPYRAIGCGLRPEKLFGLHTSDVDRTNGPCGSTRSLSLRPVEGGRQDGWLGAGDPAPRQGAYALDAQPKRIDTQILVPAIRDGYIDIERFPHRELDTSATAARLDHRRIYDCRHTFATWAIVGGSALATRDHHGNERRQIEDTYARWLKRTDHQLQAPFDAYDTAIASISTRS